jgi:tripartite-type tricarboxylate transporter receptor subunit TctC
MATSVFVVNSTGMAVNPALHRNLSYHPARNVAPIALMVRLPEVRVVNAALSARSLADLTALAKSTPGGPTYGSRRGRLPASRWRLASGQ